MRGRNRLSVRAVQTLRKPGRHADGGGLYLVVDDKGNRRWCFMYVRTGRRVEMGLGSAADVPLATARDLAAGHREALAKGLDPRREREKSRTVPTFGECADKLIAKLRPGMRSPKHLAQWTMTLSDAYCKTLRPIPVDRVTVSDVLAVVSPVWLTVPETASRLRGRIERVLDVARVDGHRAGENPARWKGHLQLMLPRQRAGKRHHEAMDWRDVPEFVGRLRTVEAVSALCLEFVILTAVRTGEAIAAEWREIDREARIWTIPAKRMKIKSGGDHRVPLSDRAMQILDELRPLSDRWPFPGHKRGTHLSNMAMLVLLRRMKAPVTVHGFRSSFRDWAGDATDHPREVVEAALAHAVGNAVEQAYRRSDALAKRRRLMDDWAAFLAGPARQVGV